MRLRWVVGVLVLGRLQGQESLTLEQAVQEALRLQPQIAQATGRVERANGEKIQAGLRPNPRMTLQSEDLRPSMENAPFSFANSTEDYFLYSQVIESGGKRGRRLDVARMDVATAEAQVAQTRRDVAAQVGLAYWAAVAGHSLQQLAEQDLRTYDEDVRYIRNRVTEGVAAEADLIRIEIERDRADARLRMAERDAVRAQLELYRWMGRSDFTAVNLSASLEERVDVPVPEISQAIEGSPQIRVAQQMAERARANTRLQRADGKPDPEAIAGYKRNVGADTAYLALQIDLPFHNRNQGNIASAIAGEHVAEADLREADLTVRTNIELARQSYLADQKLAEEMPKTVERANEAERLSRAAYREGALELLRLLDAERNRIEVQSEYYRALNELHQAAIRLRWASGQPLPGEK